MRKQWEAKEATGKKMPRDVWTLKGFHGWIAKCGSRVLISSIQCNTVYSIQHAVSVYIYK